MPICWDAVSTVNQHFLNENSIDLQINWVMKGKNTDISGYLRNVLNSYCTGTLNRTIKEKYNIIEAKQK